VYPYSVFDCTFRRRYLDVFDEVLVFARVRKNIKLAPETMPPKSSFQGVTFFSPPDFLGVRQYLKAYCKVNAISKQIFVE